MTKQLSGKIAVITGATTSIGLAIAKAFVPLGRVGRPDESSAAVFLASDAACFVNGIELFVDGGQAQV